MNTIPTTFSDFPTYTAIGGQGRRNSTGVSVVLLNRGSPFPRAVLFEDLERQGFDYVVSMEGSRRRYDLDALSAAFPFVRFILPSGALTRGEEINIAAQELSSPLFLVMWDDLRIFRGSAEKIAERFLPIDGDVGRGPGKLRRLCTVPEIQDGRLEAVPTLYAPLVIKGEVKTLPFITEREGQPSLFPFDGIGIYDRELFSRLGGFDRSFRRFYWQLMDFGFRSHLWGEEIAVTKSVKLSYEGSMTPEDQTADESYRRFYLKNIAPVFRGDHADLPLRRFPGFMALARVDILTAREEFSLAREWVNTNKYRFRSDARAVAELWDEIQKQEEHYDDSGIAGEA